MMFAKIISMLLLWEQFLLGLGDVGRGRLAQLQVGTCESMNA